MTEWVPPPGLRLGPIPRSFPVPAAREYRRLVDLDPLDVAKFGGASVAQQFILEEFAGCKNQGVTIRRRRRTIETTSSHTPPIRRRPILDPEDELDLYIRAKTTAERWEPSRSPPGDSASEPWCQFHQKGRSQFDGGGQNGRRAATRPGHSEPVSMRMARRGPRA